MTHLAAVDRPIEDDGLGAELAAAAGRRWWNKWTVYLGVAALLVGGFVAGTETQKAYGEPASQAAPATGQRPPGGGAGPGGGAPGGGAPGGGAPGGAAAPAGATSGTVKLVDGTTVYVQTESGEVVTVRTDGETAVRVPGELKDLKAGDKVTVEGDPDSAGTVTATTVTGSS